MKKAIVSQVTGLVPDDPNLYFNVAFFETTTGEVLDNLLTLTQPLTFSSTAELIANIEAQLVAVAGDRSYAGFTAADVIHFASNVAGGDEMVALRGIPSSLIDGKTVGNTSVFTNTSGKDFWVTGYAVLPQTITGLGTAPVVNVGKTAAAYSDIDSGLSFGFANNAGKASWRYPNDNFVKVANGESLVCRVATAAILTTTFTFKVLVRGVYL